MKIGLVLEGGAMRGMFTAGVLDTFLDNDIKMDSVVGVSAGALFGVNYLSGQKGRVIRYNKRFNKDKNYMGFHPLLREGILSAQNMPTKMFRKPLTPLMMKRTKSPMFLFMLWLQMLLPETRNTYKYTAYLNRWTL